VTVRYPDRTCNKCGNSIEQCECDEQAQAEIDAEIEEMKVYFLEHKRCDCFDCHKTSYAYMLTEQVWKRAMPEYDEVRAALWKWYEATQPENFREGTDESNSDPSRFMLPGKPVISVRLCYRCVEGRLGRSLVIKDFSPAPINESIRFAHRMSKREVLADLAVNSKEIDG